MARETTGGTSQKKLPARHRPKTPPEVEAKKTTSKTSPKLPPEVVGRKKLPAKTPPRITTGGTSREKNYQQKYAKEYHRRYKPPKTKLQFSPKLPPEVQANATLRMGYTRIEPIPGRPLAFVASCNVIQRQRTEWGE